MTSETAGLLEHYLERGREPWNVSLEASWLDYELRAWVRPRLPTRWRVRACNVGIGVGLWDDWLGYELSAAITSVDVDPEICRTFAVRQRRESHPYPAHIMCGDPCSGVLGLARFDVITIVGSTLVETGDGEAVERAARRALAPGGTLLVAEVGNREPPVGCDVRRLGEMWIAFRAVHA
jgi:SAM-dependent methyltransferase